MVYLVGVLGFVFGFLVGQKLLLYMLRDYSNEELLENKSLAWTYGLLNWVLAGIGAFMFVISYKMYF